MQSEVCVETNAKQNLDNFSRCIMEYNTGIAVNTSLRQENSTKRFAVISRISRMKIRHWHRFVPENISVISRGAVDLAYNRIAP